MTITRNRFLTLSGGKPDHIPHWEHWSNPDAESIITGMDYYCAPRSCRLKLNAMYPDLNLAIPESDEPIPRPDAKFAENGTNDQEHTVRWGADATATFEHGESLFKDEDDVFAFSPLEQSDFRKFPVVENLDFRDEKDLYRQLLERHELDDKLPVSPDSTVMPWFYNTMFMWPVLTFGWENFLVCCMDERFEHIMEEFAEINRRVFRAFAKLPANFVLCHDDICTTRGPVCNREWMNKYIFPRYEEYWSILKDAGKKVIFIADGNVDEFVEDVISCGASGIISEPYTNFKAIAKRHPDLILGGEGDNRILSSKNPEAIRKMVQSMTETAKEVSGYFYCVGNHIPWNVPADATKLYLDLCLEMGKK